MEASPGDTQLPVIQDGKYFYPQVKNGQQALSCIHDMLKISLPEEEGSHYDAMRAAKLISQIQSVVTYFMKAHIDDAN